MMSVETKDDFLLWPDSIKEECFGLIAAPAAAGGGDIVGAGADAAVAGGTAPVVGAPAAVGVIT